MWDPKAITVAQLHYEEMRHERWQQRIWMPQSNSGHARIRVALGQLLVKWGMALQGPVKTNTWTGNVRGMGAA